VAWEVVDLLGKAREEAHEHRESWAKDRDCSATLQQSAGAVIEDLWYCWRTLQAHKVNMVAPWWFEILLFSGRLPQSPVTYDGYGVSTHSMSEKEM
jgi:hypothetical protein